MVRRILSIAVMVCVVGLIGWYAYTHHADGAMEDGAVVSRDTPSSGRAKLDSGAVDLDGRPMSDGTYGVSGTTGTAVSAPRPAAASTGMSGASTTPAAPMRPSATPVSTTLPNSLPSSDTLSADPPNGMAFGGSGKFQWYRQGNITWRINTQSGTTCIAFATMDEWQKPIVYSHGCGNA